MGICRPVPTPASYLVLANAGAGSTAHDKVAAAVSTLAESAPTSLRWTDDAEGFRHEVSRAPADARLVVAGGDGSIHLALRTFEEQHRRGEPVGVLPLGTGNDFARNHGIPLDPVEAAAVVAHGCPTTVPVIELRRGDGEERELVANNLHIGLGVESARTAKRLKPVLGRFSYAFGTAFHGARSEGLPVRIGVDGADVWGGWALAVLVLLGPKIGGGVEVAEDTSDRLDIVAVEAAARGQRVRMAREALRARLPDSEGAHRWTGRRVSLSGPPVLDADVDGELLTLTAPVEMSYQAEGWCVVKPAVGR